MADRQENFSVAELGFGSHLWDLKDGALLQILRLCEPHPLNRHPPTSAPALH